LQNHTDRSAYFLSCRNLGKYYFQGSIMKNHGLIPDYQFGFQSKHATTEQIHRIVKRINNNMEAGRLPAQRFSSMSRRLSTRYGIENCFIKSRFPTDLYIVIRSYLLHRTFRVKYEEEVSQLKEINSVVPQGNILGPVLYLIYIADLPVALGSTTTTYANDTTVLAVHNSYIEVSSRLLESLHHIQRWFKK